ncbi:MAG: HlyD family efflux transporter periplasmic adaptor subunit [Micropruina sp.]|uniref:HlyD family efflux transporter periplasmic adaptor subunit n=1 Tax=Micropruina sp. TaxID=2737536 RepID=UPI0039E2C399
MTGARAAVAGVALGLVLTGCAQPSATIEATGRVGADVLTVQAPALTVPRVDLDAGFERAPGDAANLSSVPALLSLGTAQRIAAVQVRLGDQVRAGDVLVRFDDAALAAQQRAAKADRTAAKAQVGVIDAGIDTTHDREAEIADKRAEVTDGIAKATKARRTLIKNLVEARAASKKLPKQLATVQRTLADLKPKLAQVRDRLAQVEAALAALPPEAPDEVRAPLLAARTQLRAAEKQLSTAIAKLTTARGKLTAGIAQVTKGIGALNRAVATIDTNLAKARDGLRQLDKARQRVRDARAGLKRARKLAVIAARNNTAVDAAGTARGQAVVSAPSDGVVTSVAALGDVIAPGATVATIARPALIVTTWLAPEQVARVCTGDPATISLDTAPAPAAGRVSRILPEATYPPSYQTTDQTHLTRAVPVEITVSDPLPPGVPADIRLTPCRTTR